MVLRITRWTRDRQPLLFRSELTAHFSPIFGYSCNLYTHTILLFKKDSNCLVISENLAPWVRRETDPAEWQTETLPAYHWATEQCVCVATPPETCFQKCFVCGLAWELGNCGCSFMWLQCEGKSVNCGHPVVCCVGGWLSVPFTCVLYQGEHVWVVSKEICDHSFQGTHESNRYNLIYSKWTVSTLLY